VRPGIPGAQNEFPNFDIIVFNQRALKCACAEQYPNPDPNPDPHSNPFLEVTFLHVTRRIAKHEYVNFLLCSLPFSTVYTIEHTELLWVFPMPLYCIKYRVDFTCVPK